MTNETFRSECPLCGATAGIAPLRTSTPVAPTAHAAVYGIHPAAEPMTLLGCATCAMIFRMPRPSASSLTRYYSELLPPLEAGFLTDMGISQAVAERNNEDRFSAIYRQVTRFWGRAPGHIIDIGGWDGHSLVPWIENGWSSTLIDLGSKHRKLKSPHMRSFDSVDEALAQDLGPADIVTSYHCLEHVLSLDDWVRSVRRLSRTGTLWVLELPLELPFIPSLRASRRFDPTEVHPEHLNFFFPRSVRALASRLELDVITIDVGRHMHWHGPTPAVRLIGKFGETSRTRKGPAFKSIRHLTHWFEVQLRIWPAVVSVETRRQRLIAELRRRWEQP